ncbi:MAG: helix-turn-helix domain-containing protein [Janthinobacterium lividum]
MAREPMTLEEIRASRPEVDRAKILATTEEDIRRHQVEDGEDPDVPLPPLRPVPDVRAIRTQLGMTQETFAKAIGVPVATVRNWEQSRTAMDPAVRSLLRVVEREPDAAFRALAAPA